MSLQAGPRVPLRGRASESGALRIRIVHACRLIPEDTWVALCRCGASPNKPCRDGSHHRIEFRAVPEDVEALG